MLVSRLAYNLMGRSASNVGAKTEQRSERLTRYTWLIRSHASSGHR